MIQPTKITSEAQYKELLGTFCQKLCDSIPPEENASTALTQPDMTTKMQYGGSCVNIQLETKSSGVDNYFVYVDNNGYGQFIRSC